MNPRRYRRAAFLLLAADALTVMSVLNAVFYVRGGSPGFFGWAAIAPVVIFLLSMQLIDGYGSRTEVLSLEYGSLHLIASFAALIVTVLLTFFFMPAGFELKSSRSSIVVSFALVSVLTLLYRRLAHERLTDYRRGFSIVFVGPRADFDFFASECKRLGAMQPLIHIDTDRGLSELADLAESITRRQTHVEAIVMKESSASLPTEIPFKLVQLYFEGVPTYTLEIFHQVYWRKIPLYRINPIWLLQEGFRIAREPVFERLKRTSDVILALVGFVIASPVVAFAALAILLEDGGPVFFVQNRVGRGRRLFPLVKLRTMRVSSDGSRYTQPGDSRVTRVGRLLRAARLDELPQLWNVLRGDMSLIGPRAEWDILVAEYEKTIPFYHFRHLVKPGITGWAQINYRYGSSQEDAVRKLEYDLYYIRNFSFQLDASIVLKTLQVMLLRRGR